MDMIAHQTVCPYGNAISITGISYMVQIRLTILVCEEYIKPAIASLNDVMRVTGNYNPG